MPRLAIAAPGFSQPSETFVHHHVRTLAPGRTVLVCYDGAGAGRFGCPVLSGLRPTDAAPGPLGRLRARLVPALRRARGFGSILDAGDRRRLAGFLRGQDVALVLAEFGGMGAAVMDVCRDLDLPLYVYFRGPDATEASRFPTMRRFYRRLFRQAAGVLAVSRFIADRVVALGCPEAKLHVSPSGADSGQFLPSAREPGRILGVGRLVPTKAPLVTLAAFARIAPRFPEARLDLVGDGPLRAEVEAAARATGLAGRIRLHGALPHDACAALMARAAVFALPSATGPRGATEGFPTAIAEAMTAGVPVVATRHAGIPEHVVDGVTGRLVAEGDVAAMADALAALLADPAAAAALGDAAARHAADHLTRARSDRLLRALLDLDARLGPAAPAP
ncbi:glycosyltransferase [Amaricoccus sp.]|uniref:glycosyltransferase n=1 Tax=Amaricoccus sp. TaxID=1872485 RepID=UPI001B6FC95F|nr:glycosyltransferase [Amaricoccus sp.]MBP7000675.1 glycosyltransferase [Amaricoccus sp.]